MGRVIIIESKTVFEYLNQLKEMGENLSEYRGIFGFSIGFTESRSPIYKYPKPGFDITDELTNISMTSY